MSLEKHLSRQPDLKIVYVRGFHLINSQLIGYYSLSTSTSTLIPYNNTLRAIWLQQV